MSRRMHDRSGFIALSTVLVLSAIMLAAGIGMMSREILGAEEALALRGRDRARAHAEACADYALMMHMRSFAYAGGERILFYDGSCDVLPRGIDAGDLTIDVVGVADAYTYGLSVTLDTQYPGPVPRAFERIPAP